MSDNNKKTITIDDGQPEKKLNKVKIFTVAFALLSILITLFILSNSLLDFETSHKSSGAIVDVIIPEDAKDVLIDDKTPEFYLRKCVHFLEYAALGFVVMSLSATLARCKGNRRLYIGGVMCYTLFIAVIDEHIQSFSDRSSSTFDILLDFSGGMFGIFLSFILFYVLLNKIEKKRAASFDVSLTK